METRVLSKHWACLAMCAALCAASTIFVSCSNPFFQKEAGVYKVTFETNGGTSVDSVKTDRIKTSPATAKANCDFDGWYTRSSLSGNAVSFPYDVTEETVLFAKWLQKYEVTFDTKGGSPVASQILTVLRGAVEPEMQGFTFECWLDATGAKVSFPLALEGDTTLHAKWLENFTVAFNTNGGDSIASVETAILKTPPVPSKANCEFVGWYETQDCSGEPISMPHTVANNTTLYAKWLPTYLVELKEADETLINSFRARTLQTPPTPQAEKAGHAFDVWYIDSALTNEAAFPLTLFADTSLYAKWTKVFTVTFDAQGGSFVNPITTHKINEAPVSTMAGKTLEGWYTDAECSAENKVSFPYNVTQSATLYAKWVGNEWKYADMATVESGYFVMGDPAQAARPTITLSYSFEIAKYELTYELWKEVADWAKKNKGYNLTDAKKGYAANDAFKQNVPATEISWNMACVWLNAYSEYKGCEPVYYLGGAIWKDSSSSSGTFEWKKDKNGFRLPTECEWEYAAGGGHLTTTKTTYSGSDNINEVAWYRSNSGNEMHPVGEKKPNALGIYDMSGNVAEWCFDYYHEPFSRTNDKLINIVHDTPSDNYGGYQRVLRGGNIYYSGNSYFTIFYRTYNYNNNRDNLQFYGIRVARGKVPLN